MATPYFTSATGADAPLLSPQGTDPNRALLMQALAAPHNLPPPTTGYAAAMQTLAKSLSGLSTGMMVGQDKREREAAANEIGNFLTGDGTTAPKGSSLPGAFGKLADLIDPPSALTQVAQAAPPSPQGTQVASLTGLPPNDTGAPAAAPTAPLTERQKLVGQFRQAQTPGAKSYILNQLQGIDAAEGKRNETISAELAKQGLIWNPTNQSSAQIGAYGQNRGDIQGTIRTAETDAENRSNLQYKPRIAAATIEAETPAKVGQTNALAAPEARAAGMKTSAQEAAAFPFVEPKATAQARGSATGTAQAELAPAPGAPGVTPGGTVKQALSEAAARGTQIAQGPQQIPEKEQKLRQEYDQLPAVKTYRETVKDFSAIQDASTRDTKAADLNMVYGLAHIMDPNSVVREGEQVSVRNTASLPDWLIGQLNAVTGGSGLTPAARTEIVREAQSRLDATKGVASQFEDVYRRIAGEAGLKHENVVVPISTPGRAAPISSIPRSGGPNVTARPPLVIPQRRAGEAQAAPQFTPEQIQAEIARRGLRGQ